MNKNDVISEAIATIPGWLAFLDMKEAEQQAILAEITQDETIADSESVVQSKVEEPGVPRVAEDLSETVISPLSWLDEDEPPPIGDPQQLLASPSETAALDLDGDNESSDVDSSATPPWSD